MVLEMVELQSKLVQVTSQYEKNPNIASTWGFYTHCLSYHIFDNENSRWKNSSPLDDFFIWKVNKGT